MAARRFGIGDTAPGGRKRRLSFERLEERRLLSLTHLYTFNDGLANDWIGSAHGALVNGATVQDGQLVLANQGVTSGQTTAVQHARLGANLLSAGDATVEVWFTTSDASDWPRVFDIGSQLAGSGESYLFYTPHSAAGDGRAVLRPAGTGERVVSASAANDGAEHMAAVVIDTAAGLLRLYVDGSEVSATALDGAHAGSVNDSFAYLGRSLFNADAGFTGSINELRIFDHARTPEEIAAAAASGPSTDTKSPLVRQMEYLNRGLVAVRRATNQVYVGWRLLGTDPGDVAFNLYRSAAGGTPAKLNASPLTATTDFVDSTANLSVANSYTVRPVVAGLELEASEFVTLSANSPVQQFLNVPLQPPVGGTVAVPAGTQPPPSGTLDYIYHANDASVGDLDGDGQYEIVLKWDPSNSQDSANEGLTGNTIVDAYRLNGERLWRIDLGRNIRSGAHYTQFLVYDFDGDGRADVVMKTADGTIDGAGVAIGNASADYRDGYTGSGDGRWGRILTGPEYLTVFDGRTGRALSTINFPLTRGSASQWGDSYGNRMDRFNATVAYLDGVHPSIVWARGYYGPQSSTGQSRNEIVALDWRGGSLTQRWLFRAGYNINGNVNVNYIGQGNHNISVADVDADGKDEIIYGAAVIDDNGIGLYSTGRGHGDALHVSDMDPSRPGLEIFSPHEDPGSYGNAGGDFRDARTGQLIFGIPANNDVGRGVAADIDPNSPGYEMWATTTDPNGGPRYIYSAAGQPLYQTPSNMFYNFVVWWDADLTRELLDGTTISEWNNPGRQNFDLDPGTNGTQQFAPNAASNNGTKSTPVLSADILGDWREEVIWRRSDNTALMIFTTIIPSTTRIYTLMHDSQYRSAIAWQNVGYNQPPHPSFFLGAGMAPPPIPQIYTVQYVPALPGDYNADQVVDSADYSIWRDTFGSATDLRADGDGDGTIGNGDYDVWRENFGAAALGAGAGSQSAFEAGYLEPAGTAAAALPTLLQVAADIPAADSPPDFLLPLGRNRSTVKLSRVQAQAADSSPSGELLLAVAKVRHADSRTAESRSGVESDTSPVGSETRRCLVAFADRAFAELDLAAFGRP